MELHWEIVQQVAGVNAAGEDIVIRHRRHQPLTGWAGKHLGRETIDVHTVAGHCCIQDKRALQPGQADQAWKSACRWAQKQGYTLNLLS